MCKLDGIHAVAARGCLSDWQPTSQGVVNHTYSLKNPHRFPQNMLNAAILGLAGPHSILYADEDMCFHGYSHSTSNRSHSVCVRRNLEKRRATEAAISLTMSTTT